MRAVSDPAGERLVDKSRLEDRSNHGIDRMLNNEVAKRRCKNAPQLWLIDQEFVIRHRLVAAAVQFVMERADVSGEMFFELKAGALSALVP